MNIILAPHLDDEIIGCYSLLMSHKATMDSFRIDRILYFSRDAERERELNNRDRDPVFCPYEGEGADGIRYTLETQTSASKILRGLTVHDCVFIPSQHDFHPLHRKINRLASWSLGMRVQRYFYSVEMNVPWLTECSDPDGKKKLLKEWYPSQKKTLKKNDKYFLFESIKPYDDQVFAVVRFQVEGFHRWEEAPESSHLRNLHRHMFHYEIHIEQNPEEDRDIEYLDAKRAMETLIKEHVHAEGASCEERALIAKKHAQWAFGGVAVKVGVFEDGENGCFLG